MTRVSHGFAWVIGLCVAVVAGVVTACLGGEPAATRGGPPDAAASHNETPPPTTKPQMTYEVLQDRPDRLLVALPNRLIVLAQELHTAPVVSAQVWIKTGSIYEQEHSGAGLSHFLEHLLSGGSTGTRTEAESNAILGAIGAQTNAATSLDTVRYYINTTSPYTAQAVDLLSDWMLNSLITQQEYERERSVIQREFEMGMGDPGRIFWKLTQLARYKHHPARHPTIGYLDEFLRITRDEIHSFYKRMYVPNNMVFVVVGDIDKRQVVDQIVGLWQDRPAGELPSLQLPEEGRTPHQREQSGAADIDKPRLRLAWPGTRLAGEGDYALDLLMAILGQGESSRLVREVRDEQRLVNTIDAYNLSFPWGDGFVGVDAEVVIPPMPSSGEDDDNEITDQQWRVRQIGRVRRAVLEQVELLLTEGVAEQELARAKRKTMAAVVYNGQSAQALAGRLAGDLIGMKDPDYLRRYAEAVQAITADQLQQAAAKFLDPEKLIEITLLPQPPGEKPQELARPEDAPQAQPGQNTPIDLDNAAIIAAMSARAGAADRSLSGIQVQPIKRFVMPNGLRLLIGPNNLVPAVSIQMYQLGGLLSDPPGQEGVNNATATMLMKGTQTRTAQQIAQQVEDLGASLATSSGYNTSYARAVCLKEDWQAVLALLADVMLNPTFPQDEWSKLQPRLIAAIDRQTDSWTGELRQRFRQAYYGDFPWAWTPLGKRDVVESLRPEQMRAFYKKRLSASQSVLAVFGDVDPQQVAQRVGALFGGMPSQPEEVFKPVDPAFPQRQAVVEATQKPLAAVQIGFGPGVARRSPDYPALSVLSKVLNRFPSGWLEQELRGRGPGLVYAVGAGQFTGLVPGYFALMFNTQPESLTEALGRSMAVVERAREDLVGESDLAAAKAAVLTGEFLYKQSNSQRAAEAAINELYGLGLDEPDKFRQQVLSLDAKRLQVIARRYLRNPVTVVISHDPPTVEAVDQAMLPTPSAATQPAATQPDR